jgi:hypothetical protein
MIGSNFYITLAALHWSEIWPNIGRATLGRNFDVTIGRAAYEACSATWNLCTNSAFALGSRKTTENLDRVGRSQDLPDLNWLLARSLELNTRTLTLVPIWLLLYLEKVYTFLFTNIYCYVHISEENQTSVYNIFIWTLALQWTILWPESWEIFWPDKRLPASQTRLWPVDLLSSPFRPDVSVPHSTPLIVSALSDMEILSLVEPLLRNPIRMDMRMCKK